jgi:drug/metabolite transporter (DMT)-like permease
MLFWRSLFMTLTTLAGGLLLMGPQFLRGFRRAARSGIWVGLGIAGSLVFYVFSIAHTSVADSLLVQAAGPLFIVVLGWIVLREPVRQVTILALVAVGGGIALILVPSLQRGGFSGNLLGIAKALSFAGATVAIRRRRGVDLLPALAVGALIATVVAALVGALTGDGPAVSARSLAILAYLGVVQTGIAFMLHATFSGRLPASQTGLLVLLEAVLGPLWVWLFLAEAPAHLTLLGGAVILTALATHTVIFSRNGAAGRRARRQEQYTP